MSTTAESDTLESDAARGRERPCAAAPRVWLLLGDKAGDNAQARALADALGWPYEEKRIVPLPHYVTGKPFVRPSLAHLDPERSDPLEPPWPDLVLTIGRRPSMAALWVKRQSGRQSARRSRIVILGRPRRLARRFDLIIAAPPYRLRPQRNVLRLALPLMRVDAAAAAAAAEAWRARLMVHPRPLIALMVGGPTKPLRFDAAIAADLIAEARRLAAAAGGTLFVVTSRRTPPAIIEALAAGLPAGGVLHRWRPEGGDNPYTALLGLADAFIVTGDSISMMVEIARLGRPLAIFPLPPRRKPLARWLDRLGTALPPPLRSPVAALGRCGLLGHGRDFETLYRLLIERGLAVPLGAPFPPAGAAAPDDLALAAARIRALLADQGH